MPSRADTRPPAERRDAAHVEQLLRRAVGLARVPLDRSGVADHALDQFGELADGQVVAGADVDHAVGQVGGRHVLQQEDDGLGQVVDVEELAARGAGAPEHDRRHGLARRAVFAGQADLRLVELADHRRQHVARAQVEVVAGAIEVGRHEREVVGAVLAVETAAQLDAGDLGDRVRPVGLLERTGQQVLLLERLRRHRAGRCTSCRGR